MDVKAAYKLLARRYHPDSGGDHPVEQFHAVKAAYEALRDSKGRYAHRNELERTEARRPRDARPTTEPRPHSGSKNQPITPFDPLRQADLGDQMLDVELARELAGTGGHFTVRVPIDTRCPGCNGNGIEAAQCDLCEHSGRLRIRVRGSVRVPRGVHHLQEVRLDCFLELFGNRPVLARIILV